MIYNNSIRLIFFILMRNAYKANTQTNIALSSEGSSCRCRGCYGHTCEEIIDGRSITVDPAFSKEMTEIMGSNVVITFRRMYTVRHMRLMESFSENSKLLKSMSLSFSNGVVQMVTIPDRRVNGFIWNEIPLNPTNTTEIEIIFQSTFEHGEKAVINEIEVYEESSGFNRDVCPLVPCLSESEESTSETPTPIPNTPDIEFPGCSACPVRTTDCPVRSTDCSDRTTQWQPHTSTPCTCPNSNSDITGKVTNNEDAFLIPFIVALCGLTASLVVIAFLVYKVYTHKKHQQSESRKATTDVQEEVYTNPGSYTPAEYVEIEAMNSGGSTEHYMIPHCQCELTLPDQ